MLASSPALSPASMLANTVLSAVMGENGCFAFFDVYLDQEASSVNIISPDAILSACGSAGKNPEKLLLIHHH